MDALKKHRLGWIGIGRMGYAMAERLAKAGCDLTVYNRTREKAEPLAKHGAKIVGRPADLAGCDIVFTMVSTGKDVKEVLEGPNGVLAGSGKPRLVVDSTSISLEESAEIRASLAAREVKLLSDHRHDLVVQRTRIAAQIRWYLHELDPDLEVPSRGFRRHCVVAEVTVEQPSPEPGA